MTGRKRNLQENFGGAIPLGNQIQSMTCQCLQMSSFRVQGSGFGFRSDQFQSMTCQCLNTSSFRV